MRYKTLLLCCVMITVSISSTNAQGLLKKIKDKVNQTVNGDNSTNTTNSSTNTAGNTKRNNGNGGGEGLVITPPDVKENLTSADAAYKSGNYNEARYAVQQAMLGVEMEIGKMVLKSMPTTIANLKSDSTQDKVTSIGWGWQGLTIQRSYGSGDKQLNIDIANNAVLMQAVNMYFTNASFSQTNNGQQNWKQTKVKGNRAIIEYDASAGYKLSVPLGQSSLLVYEGINFVNEQEMMTAANQLDIDRIKKLLGEK